MPESSFDSTSEEVLFDGTVEDMSALEGARSDGEGSFSFGEGGKLFDGLVAADEGEVSPTALAAVEVYTQHVQLIKIT